VFHGPIRDRNFLAEFLLRPGGERLRPETANEFAQICEVLMMDSKAAAIEVAKRLGTYKKADRSVQYSPDMVVPTGRQLLSNDNVIFRKLRLQENLQLRNQLITLLASAIVSAVIAWAVKIL
jgi:hypothetical protein